MKELVKRSDKTSFYGVKQQDGSVKYYKMQGFTEMSVSKNPKEYTRQYVDEDFEQSDVVGYSPSVSFAFDSFTEDAVHNDIINIFDNEISGTDAVREILIIDKNKPVETGYEKGYECVKRKFAVIPDAEGNSTDAYTYSGSFKCKGKSCKRVAYFENGKMDDSELSVVLPKDGVVMTSDKELLGGYRSGNGTYATYSTITVKENEGVPFKKAVKVNVTTVPKECYYVQSSLGILDTDLYDDGDIMLFEVYIKAFSASDASNMAKVHIIVQSETGGSWILSKIVNVEVGKGWQKFYIPFVAGEKYYRVFACYGFDVQSVAIGGCQILNYGKKISLEELPSGKENVQDGVELMPVVILDGSETEGETSDA